MRLQKTEHRYLNALAPYGELIKFIVVFLSLHFFWKWALSASENDEQVFFFTTEISRPFLWFSNHLAIASRFLIESLFGTKTYLYQNQIYFDGSPGICVVWSCSGIKQYLIATAVILFAKGRWVHKLWYIPLVLVVVYLLNLIRLVGVGAITIHHMEWFNFFHKIVFRGVLYGGLFLMWVLWVEKIAKLKKGT